MLTAVHEPAAAAQATITVAAIGATDNLPAGRRYRCHMICASLSAAGTASGIMTVYLRDGATGAGAVLFAATLSVPVNGCAAICLSDLNIAGSQNTAMTLEFAAAGAAATVEKVTLGYSISR